MRIFKVHHDGKYEAKGIDNSPEAIKAEVGGCIEAICICKKPNITALGCTDGVLSDLPVNKVLSKMYGNVVFVSVSGGKVRSLDNESITRLKKKIRLQCAKKASAIYASV